VQCWSHGCQVIAFIFCNHLIKNQIKFLNNAIIMPCKGQLSHPP
jgi:hypothetical protein